MAVGIGTTTNFVLPTQNKVEPSGSICRRPTESQLSSLAAHAEAGSATGRSDEGPRVRAIDGLRGDQAQVALQVEARTLIP